MSLFSQKPSFLRPFALVALMSASIAFAGCGGGGGQNDDDDQNDDQLTELTINSTPELDGMIAGTVQSPISNASAEPVVGDLAFAQGTGRNTFQAVWSFDLSQIPAGRTVRSARLSLFLRSTNGNPDAAFVLGRLDQVNFGALFPQNFSPSIVDGNFAVINDLATVGRRDVDITAQVLADIAAGRTRTQYRLRGAIDNNLDAQADFATFTDGEDSAQTGELPQIILELE